jgi:DnaJ-class molecular chaperone
MRGKRDYYEILEVARDAGEKQIKAAYRRLARKHHPDLNRGDKAAEEKFKDVAEAFAVLSDPEKRARYDRGGHEAFGTEFDPFAGVDSSRFDAGFGPGVLDDLLSQLFGGSFGGATGGPRAGRRRGRGRDLRYETTISFVDAVRGATLELRVPRVGEDGARIEDAVKVRIPPGVEDGSTLRVPRRGDAGAQGSETGDLLLTLRVTPHPRFRRRSARDLECDVPIGIVRASLGGPVDVPTLDGRATIQVPPGTESGTTLRVRGRGAPAGPRGEPAGDLYVVIQIRPPATVDTRARSLLEELGRLLPEPTA